MSVEATPINFKGEKMKFSAFILAVVAITANTAFAAPPKTTDSAKFFKLALDVASAHAVAICEEQGSITTREAVNGPEGSGREVTAFYCGNNSGQMIVFTENNPGAKSLVMFTAEAGGTGVVSRDRLSVIALDYRKKLKKAGCIFENVSGEETPFYYATCGGFKLSVGAGHSAPK